MRHSQLAERAIEFTILTVADRSLTLRLAAQIHDARLC